MKRLIFILAFLTAYTCFSQNLVPNGGFENYNTCPNNLSCIDYSPPFTMFTWLQDWMNPMKGSTSDYFNTCAAATCSVPSNTFGYQQPRGGNAYVGGYAYLGTIGSSTTFYSEYTETKLISPMLAGKTYEVTFYVSLIMFPGAPSYNYIGTDRLGVHFSDTAIYDPSVNQHLKLSYDVVNTPGNFLTDTMNWMKVSGLYTAKGGEQYMVMGCFEDGNPITYQQVAPTTVNSGYQNLCYYFYDDVSVTAACDTVVHLHDTTACHSDPLKVKLKSTATPGGKLWSTGETIPDIVATTGGTYWCITGNGCFITLDTFTVRNYVETDINTADKFFCTDSIGAVINLSVDDSATDHAYLWSPGIYNVSNINVTNPGTYWCSYVRDCKLFADTFHVGRYKDIINREHDSVVCLYKIPFAVTLSSEPGADWYKWSTDSTEPSIVVTDTGKYSSRAQKDCIIYNDDFKLVHNAFDDKVNLGPDRLICKDEPYDANLGIGFTDKPQYLWSTGETSCCITAQESARYTLTITDGCTYDSNSVNIKIVDDCNNCLSIPDAFTPNNDGRNDNFRCIPRCILGFYQLRIFNRFGQTVFETKDVNGKWDGTFNGQDMPIATYFYQVRYVTEGNFKTYLKKGDITLIR